MSSTIQSFELHKVLREIKSHGMDYTVLRKDLDNYGEPTNNEPVIVAVVRGLFHTTKGYVTQSIQTGTFTHRKGKPMLMISYQDHGLIQNKDYVIINGNPYTITEQNNIQELDVVFDVSLERVL